MYEVMALQLAVYDDGTVRVQDVSYTFGIQHEGWERDYVTRDLAEEAGWSRVYRSLEEALDDGWEPITVLEGRDFSNGLYKIWVLKREL